jgi:hypothetical protein
MDKSVEEKIKDLEKELFQAITEIKSSIAETEDLLRQLLGKRRTLMLEPICLDFNLAVKSAAMKILEKNYDFEKIEEDLLEPYMKAISLLKKFSLIEKFKPLPENNDIEIFVDSEKKN